jgi:hypothetical protein
VTIFISCTREMVDGMKHRNYKQTEELKRGIIPDAVTDCIQLQRASADLFVGCRRLWDQEENTRFSRLSHRLQWSK